MGKILKLCKKLFGKENIVHPIVDQYKYNESCKSTSGGSLEGKNVLVIVSDPKFSDYVRNYYSPLGANMVIDMVNNIMGKGVTEISKSCGALIGPFTNIINIIRASDSSVNDNPVYSVYNLLQIESDYLIEVTKKGIISTAFITDNPDNGKAVESTFKGLSLALGKHDVIENGAIMCSEIQEKDVLDTISYLNSKYGYILAGEVLTMLGGKV